MILCSYLAAKNTKNKILVGNVCSLHYLSDTDYTHTLVHALSNDFFLIK